MKRILGISLLAFLSIALVQCTGDPGPAGEDGKDGKDGINGKDGNANVVAYLITDTTKLAWSGAYIQLYYDATFVVPDSVRNQGVVLLYMSYASSTGFWYPCPGHGPNGTFQTRFALGEQRIAINLLDNDGTAWTGGTTYPKVSAIRVILIPPSKVTLIGKKGLNLSDYEAVMRELQPEESYIL